MANSNLAQEELKAFVRRIESVEDEINALNSDKSEIYKEAKSGGFDVKQLRKVIQKRRLPAEEREEQDAVFDLYWDAVHGSAHAHVENIEEFPAEKPNPVAALRADPSLAIVEPATLNTARHPSKSGEESEKTALKVTTPEITEPQPTKAAGSDLTSPQALNGQVADIQPETADEARDEIGHVAVDAADHSLDGTGNAATQRNPGGENVDAPDVSAIPTTEHASGKTAGASAPAAPAPKYAAPGEITYETHPPEGVERSSVSIAFGNMGQDPVLIAHDLEKGTAQPIVKQGKVILDGWARFMLARDMRELDGQPMAYAVVQYDGEDPLIDAIRMNVGGRTLDDHQKKLIAAKLAQQNPKRKDDIYRAFEIFLEPV